ncbi:hypothetical protein [Cupriavidus sp. CP313]
MMHPDEIEEAVKSAALEFFLRFSRFEFALKENGKVKRGRRGVAQPDWDGFVDDHESLYKLTDSARELLGSPPDVQIVKDGRAWEWAPLTFDEGESELSKLVLAVKTVRNNLFHGGKHSAAGWDNPNRVQFLLRRGSEAVDSFAQLAGYDADYRRRY